MSLPWLVHSLAACQCQSDSNQQPVDSPSVLLPFTGVGVSALSYGYLHMLPLWSIAGAVHLLQLPLCHFQVHRAVVPGLGCFPILCFCSPFSRAAGCNFRCVSVFPCACSCILPPQASCGQCPLNAGIFLPQLCMSPTTSPAAFSPLRASFSYPDWPSFFFLI